MKARTPQERLPVCRFLPRSASGAGRARPAAPPPSLQPRPSGSGVRPQGPELQPRNLGDHPRPPSARGREVCGFLLTPPRPPKARPQPQPRLEPMRLRRERPGRGRRGARPFPACSAAAGADVAAVRAAILWERNQRLARSGRRRGEGAGPGRGLRGPGAVGRAGLPRRRGGEVGAAAGRGSSRPGREGRAPGSCAAGPGVAPRSACFPLLAAARVSAGGRRLRGAWRGPSLAFPRVSGAQEAAAAARGPRGLFRIPGASGRARRRGAGKLRLGRPETPSRSRRRGRRRPASEDPALPASSPSSGPPGVGAVRAGARRGPSGQAEGLVSAGSAHWLRRFRSAYARSAGCCGGSGVSRGSEWRVEELRCGLCGASPPPCGESLVWWARDHLLNHRCRD